MKKSKAQYQAEKEHRAWLRQCAGKTRHVTRNAAQYVLDRDMGRGPVQNIYKCQFCGWYHIGKVRKLKKQS